MAHTCTNLLTHLIFSTKNRAPHIDAELKPQLLAYMGGIVRELTGTAPTINGTADHVHLLVCLPPTVSIAEATRVLKTKFVPLGSREMGVTASLWLAGGIRCV